MEKTIKIHMNEDKSIEIKTNDVSMVKINSSERKIDAAMIYKSLDYNSGDQYKVIKDNPSNKDPEVFESLAELYQDIIDEVNELESPKPMPES